MHRRWHAPLALVLAFALVAPALADDRVLLERKSPYNTIRVTEDEDGLRVMRFVPGGLRQSVVKVGDPDHLGRVGIAVTHSLPGVGRNFQDHYIARVACAVSGADNALPRTPWATSCTAI